MYQNSCSFILNIPFYVVIPGAMLSYRVQIGSTFLFLNLCRNKWHHRIKCEKIHKPGTFRNDFKANGAAGSAKNV